MTIPFSSRNKILKYMIMIIVTLLLSLICQNGIEAEEMQVESGFAEINGTKIYYEIMGKGHPLVLIHGGFMDRRMWDNEFKIFAKDFKVIRYDLRGYEKSAVPIKPFSHIEDLFHLLKYLKIDKTYILGLSLGGMISIDFTITHPDMVDALIPVASGLNGYPYADKEKTGLKYGDIFKAAKEEGLDKAAELVTKLPFFVPVESDTVITQKMRTMIKDNFENLSLQHLYIWPSPPSIQRLSEIKAPVLVIAGDHDVTDILGVADTLVTKIAGAKKEIIHGAAHHVNMEKPNEFNRVVTNFLNNLSVAQETTGGLQTKAGYADVGKARLYYEEKGKGDPIIMIHGGSLDMRMWDDQFDVFSELYRVVRYDIRNHGNSKGVPDNSFFHEDLNELMKFLKIDKAIIMGLSLGGRLAIDFAISYPEKTKALVLCSPGLHDYPFDSPEVQKFLKEIIKPYSEQDWKRCAEYFVRAWTDGPSRKPEEVNKAVREKVLMMAENTMMNMNPLSVQNYMSPPAYGRLDEIEAPVLAVAGDLDMPDILEIVDLIEKNVPGTKKVIIKGTAHMLNMEKPDEFNSIVLEFLKGI